MKQSWRDDGRLAVDGNAKLNTLRGQLIASLLQSCGLKRGVQHGAVDNIGNDMAVDYAKK